jgi:hypothetical protein
MKKLLFENQLFFPDLKPPSGIIFKDILNLLLKNGLRTLLGIIVLILILSPFSLISYTDLGNNLIFNILFRICTILCLLYFLISVIYTIWKSWQWYIFYGKNYGKGTYKTEYKKKSDQIYESIKREFLDAKVQNRPNIDFIELYFEHETKLYENLKKDYISKFVRKNKSITSQNIDSEMTNLEKEFNAVIERKQNPKF